ncbi:conserved protein of unknown function [Nitrospira japonica]|uniref:Uncharacterized protein n=1 Tax=Nitrospira japonica TaxID=1325564 RepID=A0A1W1I1V5_9BACT|nr:hypothetical protein [Nitrospira japonica]SLM46961.1 conserved protein of unknown function [Nitrospira japonica]
MPVENNFQHDELSRKSPGDRLGTAELTTGPMPDSPAWAEAMAEHGTRLARAGVRTVLFLHGSMHGTDLFGMQRLDQVGGLKRGYSRGVSGLDALLAAMRQDSNGIPPLPGGLTPPFYDDVPTRQALDHQLKDAGNFTEADVTLYAKAVNRSIADPISCRRLVWASEHHHLGRAVATIRLLDSLRAFALQEHWTSGQRVLIQAHGQAGLVLALASNFLCPSPVTGRAALLGILSSYAAQAQLEDLASTLARLAPHIESGSLLNGAALDVVTFGTPVRYGWDPSGLGALLHIVNHRNLRTDGKSWLSKMELPQITMEMPIAWGGDYVQELAVAGSDALPSSELATAANKAIWEMVEPYDGFERWLECARRAVRFPTEGRCLSVDYKDSTGSTNPRDHYYGHAVYTRREAMLFNTAQIVKLLYGPG